MSEERMGETKERLDALCDDMNVEKEEIVNTLKTIDYEYDENRHQFV